MAIGLNEMDSVIGAAFVKSVTADLNARMEPQKNLRGALTRHRWLGSKWSPFLPIGAAYASVMIGSQMASQPWLMGGLFGFSFFCSGVSFWHTYHKDVMVGFRTNLPPDVLQAAIPLMGLSTLESEYAKTVALLNALTAKIDEQASKNLLIHLNELLTNDRQREYQQQMVTESIRAHPVSKIEGDRDRLSRRLLETDDLETRQALQQSLAQCAMRLENSQEMERGLQRVIAERETILQTLTAAQSSLLRIQTASSPPALAVSELENAVTEINLRIRAQEEAEQEIARLSPRR